MFSDSKLGFIQFISPTERIVIYSLDIDNNQPSSDVILASLLQFLSMKLATVNPELSTDIERILSKDVSQGSYGSGIKSVVFY